MKIVILILLTSCLHCQGQDPPPKAPPPVKEHLENVPPSLLQRCTRERRLAAIKKNGGDEASEQAVVDALRFLKNTQNKDGSWTDQRKVAPTAFALLCFLGNGETAGSEEFGVHVLNAIQFLIGKAVENRGKIADDYLDKRWPYEHAIAIYALSEAYLLCEVGFEEVIPNLRRAVEVGGDLIIKNQHKGGGWEYGYDQENVRGGTVALTGWQVLALKSCEKTGLKFVGLESCWQRSLRYLDGKTNPSGSFGYISPRTRLTTGPVQDGSTLTAVGGYCFEMFKPGRRYSRKAAGFIDKTMKFEWNSPHCDLYGHYFASRLMFRHRPNYWNRYQKIVFPQILKNQGTDGAFLVPNHGKYQEVIAISPSYAVENGYGKHYRTCLVTQILQTYYRGIP